MHRDAEGASHSERKREIPIAERLVAVVPVRMTEAWLLINEDAIRRASGNPEGRVPLDIPKIPKLDGLAHPKERLRDLLVVASEYRGRRRDRFDRADAVQLVANYIDDYAPLRALSAFIDMEQELRQKWPAVVA